LLFKTLNQKEKTMLSNIKIGTRLVVGFAVTLLFMLAIGVVAVIEMQHINDYTDEVIDLQAKSVEYAQRSRANVNMLRRYEKDVFINIENPTKVEEYCKSWNSTLEQCNERFAVLHKIETVPEQKKMLVAIQKNLDGYAAGFRKVFDQIKAGQIKSPLAANEAIAAYKDSTHQAEALLTEYAKANDEDMTKTKESLDAKTKDLKILVGTLAAAGFMITLMMVTFLIRSIKKPLTAIENMILDIAQGEGDLTRRLDYRGRDELGAICNGFNQFVEKLQGIIRQVASGTQQVASASTQLMANAEQIATGAEEVAAQAVTVATAGEEMSATSSDIAMNCQRAAEASNLASTTAKSGAEVVEKSVQAMGQIANRVQDAAKTVESLGSRSDQIGAIVSTIEDIADQTNLLALNAAIEAARAGEQGRGFAVVADEVRALAERTTKATREIGEMIKAIQIETKSAVTAMELGVAEVELGTSEAAKSGQALEEIQEQINAVTMQVSQVATAAEEQTATTSEISSNIHQITDVVEGTAKGAQESAAAASQLAQTAEELQRLVSQFKL
jgi:methyl-accepting chemotaxis protein